MSDCVIHTNDPDKPYHVCQKYAELQAEVDHWTQRWIDEEAKNAKLQAALQRAGELAELENWPDRFPLVYGSMTEALKEVACLTCKDYHVVCCAKPNYTECCGSPNVCPCQGDKDDTRDDRRTRQRATAPR